MELLLVDDVPGLGNRGQIVNVARGYARNFLLPKGLARTPTADVIVSVRKRAEKIKAERAAEKAELMAAAKVLAAVSVSIAMKAGEGGQLYGSVGPRQIVDALLEKGFTVEEKSVQLEAHLKAVGEYDVMVSLHPEVQVPIKVTVAAEAE